MSIQTNFIKQMMCIPSDAVKQPDGSYVSYFDSTTYALNHNWIIYVGIASIILLLVFIIKELAVHKTQAFKKRPFLILLILLIVSVATVAVSMYVFKSQTLINYPVNGALCG